MPSWNIHLEAGTRLADKLKLRGKSRQEFLLGCLLPDINNGYINSPDVKYPHHSTHYAFDEKSSLNFYADYAPAIKDRIPIYLGYLFHLFTDGYFNYNFYHNFKHSTLSRGLNEDQKRDIKHHDFWLYDTNFHHTLDVTPEGAEHLATLANQIKTVDIQPKDILEVDTLLKNDRLNDNIRGESYIFYNQKSLDLLLDNTISEFICQYLESPTPGPKSHPEAKNA